MPQLICATVIVVALIGAAVAITVTGGDASYAWGALGGALTACVGLLGVQKANGSPKP